MLNSNSGFTCQTEADKIKKRNRSGICALFSGTIDNRIKNRLKYASWK